MKLQTDNKKRPTINVTSLIDVLFLLLTFFIVTTRFVDQAALKVELPKMKHSEKVQNMRKFLLNIDASGEMTFQDKSFNQNTLREELTRLSSEIDASGGLVIRADFKLSHGEVMRFYDLIRGAGIRKIAIATTDPAE